MKIIDISKKFFSCNVYPGDPEPEYERVSDMKQGAVYNGSVVKAGVHTGTHADAPLHFLYDGISIEKMPLDAYIGPCTVIQVPPGAITGEYVDRFFPQECERLLVKSDGLAYFMDFSAQELVDRGIRLIGTDALSVGGRGNEMAPHKAFMQSNVAILESLDLSAVKPGEYFLCAAPVAFDGMEAAPVRAVLIEDYIFWSRKS